ncbi:MAG: class I SAM-dependent methyltransferase [Planctomycetota bacterium]
MDETAEAQYRSGRYWTEHADWLDSQRSLKAGDLLPGMEAALKTCDRRPVRVVDIGAGTGSVLATVCDLMSERIAGISFEQVAYEISPNAIERGRSYFPQIEFRERLFDGSEGEFEVAMLVDVFEHLENPWEMFRAVRQRASYCLVRQPLIQGFGTFWRNAYRSQREGVGHIGLFTSRQFVDIAEACGWRPLHLELVPLWNLSTTHKRGRTNPVKRLIHFLSPELASVVMSGYYLNGVFERDDQDGSTPS